MASRLKPLKQKFVLFLLRRTEETEEDMLLCNCVMPWDEILFDPIMVFMLVVLVESIQ